MGGGVGEGVQDVLGRLARRSVNASLLVGVSLSQTENGVFTGILSIDG